MVDSHHYFVLGGARSGKSQFAEDLALKLSPKPLYLATSQIWDEEMRSRVQKHQSRRSQNWQLVEEPLALGRALQKHCEKDTVILVDCLTLWVTNLMMEERNIDQASTQLVEVLPRLEGSVIFVSNEVGQGIVPVNKMARDFRDHAGLLHQKISKAADEVYFITAGLSSKLKG